MTFDPSTLDFTKGGDLVTVVAQDARTGRVLMVAHADALALQRTLETGEMHYHSRTRGLWHKGATSGNVQRVVELRADCDGDAVLARVIPAGPACHTGAVTCFGDVTADAFAELDATIDARDAVPDAASYTSSLLQNRNKRLKKIGEEAAEFVVACTEGDAARATEEASDLIYHALVALHAAGGSLDGVRDVLLARRR
jgi:phosphoribosyl-ATP pyrophosphohydrolase/phosphoribosyl-AMP cyclohydrolase